MMSPFDMLPDELLGVIAEVFPESCMALWLVLPRYRQVFDARSSRELFIDRRDGQTYIWTISSKLTVRWVLHSIDDEPASINKDCREWYWCGEYHRDNGLPAIEYADGTREWYINGELHRDNGLPAIEYADGTREWYINGELHRDNDLPAIIYANGTWKWWWYAGSSG